MRRLFTAPLVGVLCLAASPVLAGEWENDFGGMPYYTGQILPTPQEVTYADEFASLDDAALLLGESIDEDDARVNVLRHRVREMGGSLTLVSSLDEGEEYETIIAVGDVPAMESTPSVPDRPEGYIIAPQQQDNGRTVILLQGHDQQGLLWAVSSFNQLVTRKEQGAVVQLAEVYDYPASTAKRGYNSSRGWSVGQFEDEAWYVVHFKINAVNERRFRQRHTPGYWRSHQPDDVYEAIERAGELLSPLGITWYDGYRPVWNRDGEAQFRASSDE
ncbi:MAG: glycoside hydrolase family 20 zincin-like fold domain-containing protein, partial [bacterium]